MEGSQKDPLRGNGFLVFSRNCLFSLWKEDASVSASEFEVLYLGGKISSCQNPRIAALIKRPLLWETQASPCQIKALVQCAACWQPYLPPPGIRGQGLLISENQTQVTFLVKMFQQLITLVSVAFKSHRKISQGGRIIKEGTTLPGNRPYRDDDPMG